MKKISVIPERCCGCRICEMACAQHHFNVMNPKKAAIKVFSLYPNPIIRAPIVCHQCEDPDCQKSCPSDAISAIDGILRIDTELCTNCLVCVDACPYGALFVHPDLDSPLKCDMCSGSPRCVTACPKHALVITEELKRQPHLKGNKIEYDGLKEITILDDGQERILRYVEGDGSR